MKYPPDINPTISICRLSENRVSFLGVPLHVLTREQTVAKIAEAVQQRRPIQHVALNVAKFINLRNDPELRNDVFGADIVGADGMGIVLGARMLGVHVPERVAGVDLMDDVLAFCANDGYRPYFLGARQEVLDKALAVLANRHPTLRVAGSHHGYFSAHSESKIVEQIQAAKPDCLFVGMPTPRKERFMAAHRQKLDVPFIMGVGGGIDVLAGHVQRAPLAWQRSGLEWLYRVIQEPRRMWWRYLKTNILFAMIMARSLVWRQDYALSPQRSVTGFDSLPGE